MNKWGNPVEPWYINNWYLVDPDANPITYNSTDQDVIDDVDYVLDHLFNHPNTPPFIAKG